VHAHRGRFGPGVGVMRRWYDGHMCAAGRQFGFSNHRL
jgi:hypothetical protein